MKRMLALFLALLCAPLSTAGAADVLERIRARGTLVVSVKNAGDPDRAAHKDPAHFQKRDFEMALAREIARRLLGDPGRVEFRLMSKPQRLKALSEGRVDLVLSMLSPHAENLRVADFSAPYYALGAAVMQRKGDAAIREARDLAGRKLGLIARNEGRPALLDEGSAGTPASISFFDSFAAATAALERKEIDGLFSEAVNIDIWLAGQRGRFERSPPLTREPVAVAVGKGNPALLAEVNALIGELRASGRLEALAREHGLPPATAVPSFSPPRPPAP